MLGLGIVYTIFAGALWPSIAMTVQQEQLGTAYGVAVSLQNIGLATVPLLVGHLQASAGKGHFETIVQLFIFFGLAGVAVSTQLSRENTKTNGVLNLPSAEAEKRSSTGERKKLDQAHSARSTAQV